MSFDKVNSLFIFIFNLPFSFFKFKTAYLFSYFKLQSKSFNNFKNLPMEISNRSENLPTTTTSLDVFVPEKIIENLKIKEDCTQEIIEMIISTHSTQLKKLAFVFINLNNFEMERIIEITAAKTRFHRFNSTFLVFSWIKQKFLDLKRLSEVEAIYESVFVSRFRDIDPSIRAMCVQFLSDWAHSCKSIRQLSYLKYLGWALNDRNDSVRRKALKAIFRISKFSKRNDSEDTHAFIEKYKNRLLEIALKDINQTVQKEGCKTVLYIYLKTPDTFTVNEIVSVISSDTSTSDIKSLVLKRLCPDGIWDLDAMHGLLMDSNPELFKNLKLNQEDTNAFILNVIEFIKNRSTCCSSKSICFLKIIKVLKLSVDPIIFLELLTVVKDNPLNVQLVVSCLSSIDSFLEYPASTFQILDYLLKLTLELSDNLNEGNSSMPIFFIEEFVTLLKKLEDSFSIQVLQIVEQLKLKFPLPFVKCFDISDSLNDTHSHLIKCYGALWKIMKGEYSWIDSINFESVTIFKEVNFLNVSEKSIAISIYEYLELVDFTVF